MKKILILFCCLPILSFGQKNSKLTKYVAESYYIDVKLGDEWIQIEEVEDTLEIYWYTYEENKRVDILFPNTSDYKLGKLKNCITLNSCFAPSSFSPSKSKSNDDSWSVYYNEEISESVSVKRAPDGNVLEITLDISGGYRIQHNILHQSDIDNAEDRKTKSTITGKLIQNFKEDCEISLSEAYPEKYINKYLFNYCDCMVDKVIDKYKLDDNFILRINEDAPYLLWESDEAIIWMYDCSMRVFFKKEGKEKKKDFINSNQYFHQY